MEMILLCTRDLCSVCKAEKFDLASSIVLDALHPVCHHVIWVSMNQSQWMCIASQPFQWSAHMMDTNLLIP